MARFLIRDDACSLQKAIRSLLPDSVANDDQNIQLFITEHWKSSVVNFVIHESSKRAGYITLELTATLSRRSAKYLLIGTTATTTSILTASLAAMFGNLTAQIAFASLALVLGILTGVGVPTLIAQNDGLVLRKLRPMFDELRKSHEVLQETPFNFNLHQNYRSTTVCVLLQLLILGVAFVLFLGIKTTLVMTPVFAVPVTLSLAQLYSRGNWRQRITSLQSIATYGCLLSIIAATLLSSAVTIGFCLLENEIDFTKLYPLHHYADHFDRTITSNNVTPDRFEGLVKRLSSQIRGGDELRVATLWLGLVGFIIPSFCMQYMEIIKRNIRSVKAEGFSDENERQFLVPPIPDPAVGKGEYQSYIAVGTAFGIIHLISAVISFETILSLLLQKSYLLSKLNYALIWIITNPPTKESQPDILWHILLAPTLVVLILPGLILTTIAFMRILEYALRRILAPDSTLVRESAPIDQLQDFIQEASDLAGPYTSPPLRIDREGPCQIYTTTYPFQKHCPSRKLVLLET